MSPLSNHRRPFDEYATLEYLLLGDLRAAMDEPMDDAASRRWLVTVIEALLQAMPRKLEVTRLVLRALDDGRRTASIQDELFAEQQDLLRRLQSIHAQIVDSISSAPPEYDGDSRSVHDWMERVALHNRRVEQLLLPTLDGGETAVAV